MLSELRQWAAGLTNLTALVLVIFMAAVWYYYGRQPQFYSLTYSDSAWTPPGQITIWCVRDVKFLPMSEKFVAVEFTQNGGPKILRVDFVPPPFVTKELTYPDDGEHPAKWMPCEK